MAIAYDKDALLGHLLARIDAQGPFDELCVMMSRRAHAEPYSLHISPMILSSWLARSAQYKSLKCAQLIIDYCNTLFPLHPNMFADDQQHFLQLAAYGGPDMLALFDTLQLPESRLSVWNRMLFRWGDPIAVYQDTMRANCEYMKQHILVAPDVRSDVMPDSQSGAHDQAKRPRLMGVASEGGLCPGEGEGEELRFLKASNVINTWLHTYCCAFSMHGERTYKIIPTIKMSVARWESEHCRGNSRKCESHDAHEPAGEAASGDSMCRAEMLALMDDLLAFDREESTWRFQMAHPDSHLVGCPLVYILFIVHFKNVLDGPLWDDGEQMSASNRSHPLVSLFELYMGHVAALSLPLRHIIYQVIFSSISPGKRGNTRFCCRSYERRLLVLVVQHFAQSGPNLPANLESFMRLCVHFYGRAIRECALMQVHNLHSASSCMNLTFEVPRAQNVLQCIAFVYYFRTSLHVHATYSVTSPETPSAPNSHSPILAELFDAARPISLRDQDSIQAYVRSCIPLFPSNCDEETIMNGYLFGAELFRLAMLASTVATARDLVVNLGIRFQKGSTIGLVGNPVHFPLPARILLHFPSLLSWSQICNALNDIPPLIESPQSLRDIARNAVWVALLGGVQQEGDASEEDTQCLHDRIDALRLPAWLTAFLHFK